MSLRSIGEHYTIPIDPSKITEFNQAVSVYHTFMSGFHSQKLENNPKLQQQVGIILKR